MASGLVGKVDVQRALTGLQRDQVPFALAVGLTRTVQRMQSDVERSLPRVFDRPTPFTQRAIGVRTASKRRLSASVFVKDKQARYLGLQEEGGTRLPKRRALVVPANVRLNKYGNMTRRKIQALLKRDDVFSGRVGGTGGIWQRRKRGAPKLLVSYAKRARYRPRFDFRKTAVASFMRHAPERFGSAAALAGRTARRG